MKLQLMALLISAAACTAVVQADTPGAHEKVPATIAESQQNAASVLPEAYRSYATNMKTIVKDYKSGFAFIIPWRVSDGVMVDMDVRSESEHIQGYSFNLTGPEQSESYTVSFTKRNNTPQGGVSQKVWNTTWYNVPIKGMNDEQYLSVWRQNSSIFDTNDVLGGFFTKRGAQAARWSRVTPKSYAEMTNVTPVHSVFEAEFIMEKDPTHRYNLVSTYPPAQSEFIEKGLTEVTVPSFELISKGSKNSPLNGVKKILTGTNNINVAEGIKFMYPKGFSRLKEPGRIAFSKGDIRLDIESFSVPLQAVSSATPTMLGKQMLGDQYVKQLVDVNKAVIDRYETHIIDGNVIFYIAGSMKNPDSADTADAPTVAFSSSIVLGNGGVVGVARMIAPSGTVLTTPDLVEVSEGFRLADAVTVNNSSKVL